jgi:uncharacterized membrane protein YraQ (UPF0718 family)
MSRGPGHLRRALIILSLGIAVTAIFWLGSRYPDLDAKAAMAGDGSVGDVLSVWPLLEVRPEFPMWKKIAFSSLNWASDNKKGMAFGVFLGAIFLTLLSYIRLPEAKTRFGGALLGFVVGTPLGVCVNCAAPVMKGVLQSRRVETAFAAMISSPTMNIVVLTMVFTLFPFYMAVLKVGFALLAIFIAVPLLSRVIGEERVKDLARVEGDKFSACEIPPRFDETLVESVLGASKDLWRSLVFMFKKTVPLMLVAGVLGAATAHLIPLGALESTSGKVGVIIAAAAGVALPCPIAFDVLLTNALWQQGLPVDITLVLLCTLGIYSVYPFLLTWQSASKEWAIGLFVWFFVLGAGLGLLGDTLHRVLFVQPNIAQYQALIAKDARGAIDPGRALPAPRVPHKPALRFKDAARHGDVVVTSADFQETASGAGRFVKHEGHELGLVRGFRYGIRDYPDPFWIGRGTAAGDIDGDGWSDVVFGSDAGPVLYMNTGGAFEPVALRDPHTRAMRVYAVALVDLSGDGRPELFFTTFGDGNWIVPNVGGRLDFRKKQRGPDGGGVLTISPAFGDVDGDGRLDVVLGNMALGVITGSHRFAAGRDNAVAYNRGDRWEVRPLEGASGESMSTLLSDLDGDGRLDLMVGNDFVVPDEFYRGTPEGLKRVRLVDRTPVFSMGADTADIDNDLDLDLLLTGTIRRKSRGPVDIDGVPFAEYSKPKWGLDVCAGIQDPFARKNCEIVRAEDDLGQLKKGGSLAIDRCLSLEDTRQRQSCLLAATWALVTHNDVTEDCAATFTHDATLRDLCELLRRKGARYEAGDFPTSAKQVDDSVLFVGDGRGRFMDINEAAGDTRYDHPGGWTWGARMADLDNDGWQDIFNADGTVRKNDFGWNVFLKNKGRGQGFEQKQFSAGLTDDFSLFSFAVLDYDHDGDLDLIGNSSTGPVQVYENQLARGRSISVSLFDQTTENRAGVGARVLVRAGNLQALRELKLSGGYQSFDAVQAHFGLGDEPMIDELIVRWPGGAESRVAGPLYAGKHYRVERVRP